MARKRRATEEHTAVHQGLEPAWSASPSRNPRFVLYCVNHENDKRYVVNSYGCYAIKKILDYMIDGQEVTRGGNLLQFGEIDVRSDQLDDILKYEYTDEEEAWSLPSPYPEDINRFVRGCKTVEEGEAPKAPVVSTKKQKVDRTGKTSIQELCEELKIEPRDARAALRKAKIEKPAGGWLFCGDELDKIRAIINKGKK